MYVLQNDQGGIIFIGQNGIDYSYTVGFHTEHQIQFLILTEGMADKYIELLMKQAKPGVVLRKVLLSEVLKEME